MAKADSQGGPGPDTQTEAEEHFSLTEEGKKEVLDEAKRRYKRALDFTSDARKLILADLKFDAADSDNNYQWPNDLKKNRDVDDRPTMTINQVRQHNLHIINDAKQHKPGINYRPTGGGATYEAAQALQAIVRHIEYQSRAEVAYDTATEFQVKGGLGWLKVKTDFANPQTFDQEIFIERVADVLSVLIDSDAKEKDRSDANWGFIFEDLDKDEAKDKYSKYKKYFTQGSALDSDDGWLDKNKVRVAEYWRRVFTKDRLVAYTVDSGEVLILRESLIPAQIRKEVLAKPGTRVRDVLEPKVEWHFIVGNTIVDSKDWAGKYIPIVPVIGEETCLDGKWDVKGHTRALKDPQRMYNYMSSAAVEFVALQGKTPWIAPAEAIEEYEDMWENANNINYSVLPYNNYSDDGQMLQKPERAPAPVQAQAYIVGMQTAKQELMFASGQYQAMMGEQSNERTGKAIEERQRQGDTATYHYIDNLSIAIRQVGRIILDLIPKVYDTQRVIQAIGEDGVSYPVMIDPTAQKAWQGDQMRNKLEAQRCLNPTIGTYDVMADVGPNYATKRQEAFNALTLILTQAPQLTSIVGDLLLKAGDFPMADEASERLRRMVPPQALGQGPSVQEQMLQQQVQTLQKLLSDALDKTAENHLRLVGKDQARDIEAYNAETQRLKLIGEGEQAMAELQMELFQDMMANPLKEVSEASQPTLDEAEAQGTRSGPMAPHLPPGVREGADSRLYARNYSDSPLFSVVGQMPQQAQPTEGEQ